MTDRKKSRSLLKFDSLQSLLEKQIELAKRGNISKTESLERQANSLIEEIMQEGHLEPAEFADRRKKLKQLFDDLCITIAAQKADVSEKISRIRKGRKTIQAYRSNI
jgi:hypothetical protein